MPQYVRESPEDGAEMTVLTGKEFGAKADAPADGADSVDTGRAEQALRRYVGSVADGLGLGAEGAWCELADEATGYLALDQRLGSRPGRDVALVWDERRGWAVGVETSSGEDLLAVAWYGAELLPTAAEVVRFTRNVLAGRVDHPTPPLVPEDERRDVRARLARAALSD